MATVETMLPPPPQSERGEPCGECGASLTEDQRYCLSCGARLADPRVAYRDVLTRPEPGHTASDPTPALPARDWTPMIAVAALGGLALVLVIGVLIGKSGFGEGKAGGPQVIRVGPSAAAAPGTAVASASTGSFESDWPSGRDGYTVELGVLPKSGTDPAGVQKAKSDAEAKGATAVGALDSDDFKSLPGGNYVVYSGLFPSKAKAAAALKKLKGKFPDAQVVQVSAKPPKGKADYAGKKAAKLNPQQLQELNNLSGDDYEKRSRKLPTTTALPGKPPPTDTKAPGGGSGADTIK